MLGSSGEHSFSTIGKLNGLIGTFSTLFAYRLIRAKVQCNIQDG
jgi:hypothetical protein